MLGAIPGRCAIGAWSALNSMYMCCWGISMSVVWVGHVGDHDRAPCGPVSMSIRMWPWVTYILPFISWPASPPWVVVMCMSAEKGRELRDLRGCRQRQQRSENHGRNQTKSQIQLSSPQEAGNRPRTVRPEAAQQCTMKAGKRV